jgi:hypothetical protein
MSDSRTDSLAARLKRASLFDEYFLWVFSERPSFSERLEWLEKHSCSTSAGAVHRLHRSPEAAVWRAAEAAKARKAMDSNLPKDLEETFRKSLLNARFNEVMGELSHKEMMDHYQLELDSAHLKLKERQVALKEKIDPAKLAQADRRISLLENAAVAAKEKLAGIVSKGGLSPETLQQIEEAAGLL